MKTILVCTQKGGCGKSLIADELAFSFERTGTPLNFYDLDEQGGVIHTTQEYDDAQVAVVDTPGALQPELKDWMRSADVIVIPTRCTSRDIQPLTRMIEAANENAPNTPVVYVLNGYNRWSAAHDFEEWFRAFLGRDAIIHRLPQSESFVRAGLAEKSVIETAAGSKAAAAALELVNTVRRLAGFPEEAEPSRKSNKVHSEEGK